MLLSINQSNNNNILLDIGDLKIIHVAAVIGGVIWSHGSSKTTDGVYQACSWKEQQLISTGTITVGFVQTGTAPPPDKTTTKTMRNLKNEIEKLSERSKEFAKKAEEYLKKQPKKANKIYEAVVTSEGKTVFKFKGEHIQFDVDWQLDKGCKFLMLGIKDYSNDEESRFTGNLNDKEYVISIKS